MKILFAQCHRYLCALALSVSCVSTLSAGEGEGFGILPYSLAQWYKPENERQVWLHTMFAMRRELQAMEEYAELRDSDRLQKWAGRLAEHYRQITEMVPEWEDEVELGVVERLERAAREVDFKEAGAAAKRLRRSCRSCHREFRALAAARFRGPRFEGIKVRDSSGAEQGYGESMEDLSQALNQIKIASEDERWVTADQALAALRTGLDQLGKTCAACHDDEAPRQRILGGKAQASFGELSDGLTAKDKKVVGRYLGQAAVQVCARCHGVHRILTDLTDRLSPRRH